MRENIRYQKKNTIICIVPLPCQSVHHSARLFHCLCIDLTTLAYKTDTSLLLFLESTGYTQLYSYAFSSLAFDSVLAYYQPFTVLSEWVIFFYPYLPLHLLLCMLTATPLVVPLSESLAASTCASMAHTYCCSPRGKPNSLSVSFQIQLSPPSYHFLSVPSLLILP